VPFLKEKKTFLRINVPLKFRNGKILFAKFNGQFLRVVTYIVVNSMSLSFKTHESGMN
jgi:hypothetical protein